MDLSLRLRGEAGVRLAALLRGAGVGRRGRQVHGRVAAGGGAFLVLQELLRVPLLVVWPRRPVLGLVGVGVLHGHVAVAVVGVGAAAGGRGGRLEGHGALARGPAGRGVQVLLALRGPAGVALGVWRRGQGVGSVPRLASRTWRFRVGSPLLVHGGACARAGAGAGAQGRGESRRGQLSQLGALNARGACRVARRPGRAAGGGGAATAVWR